MAGEEDEIKTNKESSKIWKYYKRKQRMNLTHIWDIGIQCGPFNLRQYDIAKTVSF